MKNWKGDLTLKRTEVLEAHPALPQVVSAFSDFSASGGLRGIQRGYPFENRCWAVHEVPQARR
ncbi:MAG: hypothetical protein OEZ20_02455 [candidate division WOR-3 bacterium]|nr:hypothetical protein [candidate division WOR-3 bacterium]MDH5683308.1 hypothetical protein [candidate division WOR-3 bacterium]